MVILLLKDQSHRRGIVFNLLYALIFWSILFFIHHPLPYLPSGQYQTLYPLCVKPKVTYFIDLHDISDTSPSFLTFWSTILYILNQPWTYDADNFTSVWVFDLHIHVFFTVLFWQIIFGYWAIFRLLKHQSTREKAGLAFDAAYRWTEHFGNIVQIRVASYLSIRAFSTVQFCKKMNGNEGDFDWHAQTKWKFSHLTFNPISPFSRKWFKLIYPISSQGSNNNIDIVWLQKDKTVTPWRNMLIIIKSSRYMAPGVCAPPSKSDTRITR